ncbi:MAG: hypothetical protein HONBIEJF_01021 [Fimbriimonadaceae bacterium]|nr:hypothetical protein [Fimbriimonadaceae bacterium]
MRILALVFLVVATAATRAEELWIKISLQGIKLGYASYQRLPDPKGFRSESIMVLNSKMLGSALGMRISSVTWTDKAGKTLRMSTVSESSGRKQVLLAKFTPKTIEIDLDNNGQKSKKSLKLPKDGFVLDDPTQSILSGTTPAVGKPVKFYILDPTTISLVANEVVYKGKGKANVEGRTVDAEIIEVRDPRANSTMYVSAKGDLIYAEGPMGMKMVPTAKEDAIATEESNGAVDLAFATALTPQPTLENPLAAKRLDLTISGADLGRIPSDGHQTVTRSGSSWSVIVHPVKRNPKPVTIAAARKAQPQWVKPDLHVPSDSAKFRNLSKKLVGNATDVMGAASRIKAYVHNNMKPNAGIGVLRDATEVLETKEGVCRDYAILTAALMRAAGIPTKMASGLVSLDGRFFYHAWVEIWDGKGWFAIDSTRPEASVSASHVKLAGGTVGDAFVFKVLHGATIKVNSVQY